MFRVFIPDTESPMGATAQQAFPVVGLADWSAGAGAMKVTEGPDERSGTVYSWVPSRGTAEERRMNFDPEKDDVFPAVATTDLDGTERAAWRYAILWPKGWMPRPDQLAHRYPALGREAMACPLGEHNWLVPSQNDLPCTLMHTRDGRAVPLLQEEFQSFGCVADGELARVQRNDRIDQEGGDEPREYVSWDDAMRLVLASLRINYRISAEVSDAIGLLTTANIMDAYYRACGFVDAAILARREGE